MERVAMMTSRKAIARETKTKRGRRHQERDIDCFLAEVQSYIRPDMKKMSSRWVGSYI